jgi:hypothetical protein
MARVANRFTAADGTFYDWLVNHDEEDAFGRERNIEVTATVAGATGNLVRQQGDDSPPRLRLSGKILHQSQVIQMDYWMLRTRYETIHFRDFAGDEYEVIITSFQPKRIRTIKNPRDPAAPLWYWSYTLEMQVIRAIAGARVWMGA